MCAIKKEIKISVQMSRLIFLLLFVFPLSLGHIRQDSPINEEFLRGLEKFAVAAKKQLADKPIPDMNHWRLQRTETIDNLKELTEKIKNSCFYFSWADIVDSTLSYFCKLTSLMELLLKYLPSALYNMNFSSFMCPAALFTEKAWSILESILSPNFQNNLQTILIKDSEISRSLNEWFQSLLKLETEVQNIFGFDLKSEKSINFVLLAELNRLLTFTKKCKEALDLMKHSKYSKFLKDNYNNDLSLFCIHLKNSPLVSEKIQLSLSILSTLTSATKIDYKGFQKSRMKKVAITISCVWDKLDIDISPEVKSYAFILPEVIDVAREITSFQNSRNIFKDGKCPHSDCLQCVIDALDLELTFMKSSFSI